MQSLHENGAHRVQKNAGLLFCRTLIPSSPVWSFHVSLREGLSYPAPRRNYRFATRRKGAAGFILYATFTVGLGSAVLENRSVVPICHLLTRISYIPYMNALRFVSRGKPDTAFSP